MEPFEDEECAQFEHILRFSPKSFEIKFIPQKIENVLFALLKGRRSFISRLSGAQSLF